MTRIDDPPRRDGRARWRGALAGLVPLAGIGLLFAFYSLAGTAYLIIPALVLVVRGASPLEA